MSGVFKRTGALSPNRSVFDLSYEKKFDCDMGQLIPVMCDEVIPGDKFSIGNEIVIRFNPLVAPLMHEINAYVHYFFVPYRLLSDDWEEFITGGKDGESTVTIPMWELDETPAKYSLWDYFGFPMIASLAAPYPLKFPKLAYYMIWNEYYRDPNLDNPVDLSTLDDDAGLIYNRKWEKDYFTSALPFQQRGIAPALPISGTSTADFDIGNFANIAPPHAAAYLSVDNQVDPKLYINSSYGYSNAHTFFNNNTVDLSSASTFDVSDLRLAFQIQKWMERNARGGARYTEFLKSHFGVSPRDDRLQRPEYIGGSKSPVIISEVLQTSETDGTPQGNLAGHGITADRNFCASYYAQEYGLIMGILSVMPRSAYSQGIDRQWLRETKYDFYFPEFANLSEQAVMNQEIFAGTVEGTNRATFGYQGRYDEMRVKKSIICGDLRSSLEYWHLGRSFAALPDLNGVFVTCTPRKDIFAVENVPGLIVSFGNRIKAVRPMPIQSEPGLIDHN